MRKKVFIPIIIVALLVLLGAGVVAVRILEKYNNQSMAMSNTAHPLFVVIQQKLPDGWNISERSQDKIILKKLDATVIVQATSGSTYNAFKNVDSFNEAVVPFFKKKGYDAADVSRGTIAVLRHGKEMNVSSVAYTLTDNATKKVTYHFDSVLVTNGEHAGVSITIPAQDRFIDAQRALLAIQIVD